MNVCNESIDDSQEILKNRQKMRSIFEENEDHTSIIQLSKKNEDFVENNTQDIIEEIDCIKHQKNDKQFVINGGQNDEQSINYNQRYNQNKLTLELEKTTSINSQNQTQHKNQKQHEKPFYNEIDLVKSRSINKEQEIGRPNKKYQQRDIDSSQVNLEKTNEEIDQSSSQNSNNKDCNTNELEVQQQNNSVMNKQYSQRRQKSERKTVMLKQNHQIRQKEIQKMEKQMKNSIEANKYSKKLEQLNIIDIVKKQIQQKSVKRKAEKLVDLFLFSRKLNRMSEDQINIINDKVFYASQYRTQQKESQKQQENTSEQRFKCDLQNQNISRYSSFSSSAKKRGGFFDFQIIYDQKGNIDEIVVPQQKEVLKAATNSNKFVKFFKALLSLMSDARNYLAKNVEKLLEKIPIFDPNNKIAKIVDWTMLYLSIYWIYIICIFIGFQYQLEQSKFNRIINLVSIIMFVIEIVIRMNIGIYRKGHIVLNRKKIAKIYINTSLFPDMICLCVQIYLLKYPKQNIQNFIVAGLYMVKYYPLVRWMGTIWHIVAKIEIYFGETNTWIQNAGLVETEWYYRYISAFYQSLATCLLIGSQGPTAIESCFTIIFLLVTISFFAYFLSTISLIIEEINKKSSEQHHDMQMINLYMRQNKIEKTTQNKIRSYLEYVYQDREKMKQNISVKEVLEKLPKQLNDEIIGEINLKLLKTIPFFSQNFSLSTLSRVAKIAVGKNYVTNELILDNNSTNERCLQDTFIYIISQGSVEICFTSKKQELVQVSKLGRGQIFGDLEFITGFQQNTVVRSSSFVTLLKIKRKVFLEILQSNKSDYEKFQYMKEQIIYEGVSDYYSQRQCFICNSSLHNEYQCRLYCFRPFHSLALLHHQSEQWQKQERQRYFRPEIRINAYDEFDNLEIAADDIQNNYQYSEFIEEYNDYLKEKLGSDYTEVTQQEEKTQENNGHSSLVNLPVCNMACNNIIRQPQCFSQTIVDEFQQGQSWQSQQNLSQQQQYQQQQQQEKSTYTILEKGNIDVQKQSDKNQNQISEEEEQEDYNLNEKNGVSQVYQEEKEEESDICTIGRAIKQLRREQTDVIQDGSLHFSNERNQNPNSNLNINRNKSEKLNQNQQQLSRQQVNAMRRRLSKQLIYSNNSLQSFEVNQITESLKDCSVGEVQKMSQQQLLTMFLQYQQAKIKQNSSNTSKNVSPNLNRRRFSCQQIKLNTPTNKQIKSSQNAFLQNASSFLVIPSAPKNNQLDPYKTSSCILSKNQLGVFNNCHIQDHANYLKITGKGFYLETGDRFHNYLIYYPNYNMKNIINRMQKKQQSQQNLQANNNYQIQIHSQKRKQASNGSVSLYALQMKYKNS